MYLVVVSAVLKPKSSLKFPISWGKYQGVEALSTVLHENSIHITHAVT